MKPTRSIALLRWLAAATIGSAVIWQVTDRVANNLFRPGEYFAYFSIQGTIIAAVLFAYTGWLSWAAVAESRLVTIMRASATTYVIVIALVYNALLRDSPPDARDIGYVWPVVPNEIMHVWAAVIILLDWVLVVSATKIRMRAAFWVAAFPLAWLAFSISRGLLTDWWAYWFLNPNDPGGVQGMVTYIGGITVLMITLGFVLFALRKLSGRIRNLNI